MSIEDIVDPVEAVKWLRTTGNCKKEPIVSSSITYCPYYEGRQCQFQSKSKIPYFDRLAGWTRMYECKRK